jgi:hypothetical protein
MRVCMSAINIEFELVQTVCQKNSVIDGLESNRGAIIVAHVDTQESHVRAGIRKADDRERSDLRSDPRIK